MHETVIWEYKTHLKIAATSASAGEGRNGFWNAAWVLQHVDHRSDLALVWRRWLGSILTLDHTQHQHAYQSYKWWLLLKVVKAKYKIIHLNITYFYFSSLHILSYILFELHHPLTCSLIALTDKNVLPNTVESLNCAKILGLIMTSNING